MSTFIGKWSNYQAISFIYLNISSIWNRVFCLCQQPSVPFPSSSFSPLSTCKLWIQCNQPNHKQFEWRFSILDQKILRFFYHFYSTPSTEGVESTRGNSVCLSVCLSVRLSVITFSFFEYSMIWWFRPCKPYIFWKLIMLATSSALFWPSNTEYQPVPPSTDQVFNDLMV